jgi:flagellar motor protein MotB
MANQNPTLAALYQSLCSQQDALSAALQKTSDPNLADTLSTENYEIMHRIVLTQNLLFQSDSSELQADVKGVQIAASQLQNTIANIQKAADVVNGVTQYLTLVDEAIDLAKTLAAA